MEPEAPLDEDVIAIVNESAAQRGVPFRRALNDLVRAGLDYVPEQPGGTKPFKTKPLPVGRQLVDSFDDIEEVLATAEGETHR